MFNSNLVQNDFLYQYGGSQLNITTSKIKVKRKKGEQTENSSLPKRPNGKCRTSRGQDSVCSPVNRPFIS